MVSSDVTDINSDVIRTLMYTLKTPLLTWTDKAGVMALAKTPPTKGGQAILVWTIKSGPMDLKHVMFALTQTSRRCLCGPTAWAQEGLPHAQRTPLT